MFSIPTFLSKVDFASKQVVLINSLVRSIGILDYSIFNVVLSSEISNPGKMLCLVISIEPSSYSSSLDLIYLLMIVQSTLSPYNIGYFLDLTWRSFGLADLSN